MKYFVLFMIGLWFHMVFSPDLPYGAVLAIKFYLVFVGWYGLMTYFCVRK
jgi:hypothetical protein